MKDDINIFIAYAHEEIDRFHVSKLKEHLSPIKEKYKFNLAYDGEIKPGKEWEDEIGQFLETADIIILLLSSSFFHSKYIIDKELPKALERHREGSAIILPIISRPCHGWQGNSPIGRIQVLPKNALAISSFEDIDEAFVQIVQGIEEAVVRMRVKKYGETFTIDQGDKVNTEGVHLNETLYFKAFFYTYRMHETREIDFLIQISNGIFSAKINGLHFVENTGEKTGEEYLGNAEKVGNRLFFNLDSRYPEDYFEHKNSKKLQIILHLGDTPLRSHAIIIGEAQWISSFGYPVAAEMLLYRIPTIDSSVSDEDKDKIYRYVMFKRSMRRVPDRIITKTNDLRIKTNRLDSLSDIKGVYRVWTYYKGGIVQSRFTIQDNYDTLYETKTYGREGGDSQVCLLNISTIQGRQRICMSHHPKNAGTEILAYSIVDIPFEDQIFTKGTFCSMGRQGAEHQHCGWMLLKKEKMASDFEVAIYPPEKIKDLIQYNPSLKNMLEMFNKYSDSKIVLEKKRKLPRE